MPKNKNSNSSKPASRNSGRVGGQFGGVGQRVDKDVETLSNKAKRGFEKQIERNRRGGAGGQ